MLSINSKTLISDSEYAYYGLFPYLASLLGALFAIGLLPTYISSNFQLRYPQLLWIFD